MTARNITIRSFFLLLLGWSSSAFLNPYHPQQHRRNNLSSSLSFSTFPTPLYQPAPPIPPCRRCAQRRRPSRSTALHLFGLGVPEIAIILIAAAFLLGPQKLSELGKDVGKIAGELKEVPKEFQKGFEEGEGNIRAKGAKPMEALPPEIEESNEET